MDTEIKKFINDILDISQESEYHFRKIYGFTFVFKEETTFMKNRLSSAQIEPIGIIYEENGDYYLAPLGVIEDIKGVVKEYVKNCLQK